MTTLPHTSCETRTAEENSIKHPCFSKGYVYIPKFSYSDQSFAPIQAQVATRLRAGEVTDPGILVFPFPVWCVIHPCLIPSRLQRSP